MEDIKAVLIKNLEMNLPYIRRWLDELSTATGESFTDRFNDVLKEVLDSIQGGRRSCRRTCPLSALWDNGKSCRHKVPVKGKSHADPMLFHGGETDRVSVAEILVLIFLQDLFSVLFQGLIGVNLTDSRARLNVLQKCHGWSMTYGAAYQDVGFSNDKVCCRQKMIVFNEAGINTNGLFVILIRFVR